MHYVLNLTLRAGEAMPTYLPNCEVKKVAEGDEFDLNGDDYRSSRYAIFAKFYEFTVRIVDTDGKLLAVWDGVHHCAPLIRSYVQRDGSGVRGGISHPNFSFSNTTRTFSKMEIAVIGEPEVDQPVVYVEDAFKIPVVSTDMHGERYKVTHTNYRDYPLPITPYGENSFQYFTLPKKGDRHFNGDPDFEKTGARVVVLNKARKNFTDETVWDDQYRLEKALANVAHCGYKNLFSRYNEHLLRKKGMEPVGKGLDYLDNIKDGNGTYELKTFTMKEINVMSERDFKNLLGRIAEFPQDIVEKNLSPADINAIVRYAYFSDKSYKLSDGCPDRTLSPLLDQLVKIPSLKIYAEPAFYILEENQSNAAYFLANPYRRVKAQISLLPEEEPVSKPGNGKHFGRGMASYRFAILAPGPDHTTHAEPIHFDTQQEASKQVNIAYAKLPRQEYLERAPEPYLSDMPFLEDLEPPKKYPRLTDPTFDRLLKYFNDLPFDELPSQEDKEPT